MRSHVFDPVASQLLGQEEAFVSISSMDEMEKLIETPVGETEFVETECVDRSYIRQNSLPNLHPCPRSPIPLFRKVSSSLHDVKTEDDLSLLARPVPRKLS